MDLKSFLLKEEIEMLKNLNKDNLYNHIGIIGTTPNATYKRKRFSLEEWIQKCKKQGKPIIILDPENLNIMGRRQKWKQKN